MDGDGWGDLPKYIARDYDDHLRGRLREAATKGGFLVLVGDSSVGKTRSLCEAVRAVLPDWKVLIAADAAAVRAAIGALPPRTVVWLDDTPIERYLTETGQGGLTRTDLVTLLTSNAPAGPFIVVDALWRTRYQGLTATPQKNEVDRYRDAREVLALAGEIIEVGDRLSETERARAVELAMADPLIADALDDTQFGVTQHLAGAPEIVRRWQQGDAYARALITGAIDAYRLGIRTPLPVGLLQQIAAGYLTDRERATAPQNWFDAALAYATAVGKGATAPLMPRASDDAVGVIRGYVAVDYLLQPARHRRGPELTPAAVWDVLASKATDPADLVRLAESARDRALYRYAEPLYRRAIAAGNTGAHRWLAGMLAAQGRYDEADIEYQQAIIELQKAVAAGDHDVRRDLADLLRWQGRLDDLRAMAIAGEEEARWRLIDLLEKQGRLDELRQMHANGDHLALKALVDVLVQEGRIGELAELAIAGETGARRHYAELLTEQGRLQDLGDMAMHAKEDPRWWQIYLHVEQDQVQEAFDKIRELAASGHEPARLWLAYVLVDNGEIEEGIAELRALTQAKRFYHRHLVQLLLDQGRIDEAIATQQESQEGNHYLMVLLGDHGRVDKLRIHADAGSPGAKYHLARALARTGNFDELHARANVGDHHAVERLAVLLVDQGRLDDAIAMLSDEDAKTALHPEARDREGPFMVTQANKNGQFNHERTWSLDELLAKRGRFEELRRRVAAGRGKAYDLGRYIAEYGSEAEADLVRRCGLNPDGSINSPHDR
jgi:tetratricopeptide (TPR) repeat protein